jgi:hypothetical protein
MRLAYKYLMLLTLVVILGSCKKWDTLLQDPNRPQPDAADVDLYTNAVQLNFRNVFNGANDFGLALTRMEVWYGPNYNNAYSANSFDALWSSAYTGVIKNADAMIPLAKQQSRFIHASIGNILKAYTLMTLVDMFGDVPLAEANQGVGNTNPQVDRGADVYAAAIAMLDTAIADLNRPAASILGVPVTDLFYPAATTVAAKATAWRRVAKTLKLRAYVNTKLVDNSVGAKINALITDGELITTDAHEWSYKFSSRQDNPNSRHPKYNAGYVASGGAAGYVGTYFLFASWAEKSPVVDPRRRFYHYRQTLATPGNSQQMPCAFSATPAHFPAGTPYCYLPGGLWGRDHGDNSGIPPDGTQRTVWGVYPAAGRFDENQGSPTSLNTGGQGAGILPLWMSFFTDFVRAEAALTIAGVTGDARALLESGIRKSMTRVFAFPAEVGVTVPASLVPTAAQVTAYVDYVLAQYDAAGTNQAKMDIVGKEYYLALWGNGVDAYNLYRRTCTPKNIQPARQPNPGPFMRSMLYPSDAVNLNININQKPDVTQKVFWDTQGNCTY